MSSTAAQSSSRVSSAISEQRDTAHEQLAAAWQLQMYRVEEALSTGWQEQIERVFNERFTELAERIERELEAEVGDRVTAGVDAASPAIRERARRETAEEFGGALRRFLDSETDEKWGSALIDSIGTFCARAVLLSVRGRSLRVIGVRGEGAPGVGVEVALEGALAAATKSRDALITTTTAGEISAPIAAFFEKAAAANCAVMPVMSRGQAAAVLIAAGEGMDVSALEAMAALAGLALERRGRAAEPSGDASHLRAQRFARVRAAEILLYKPQAVWDGRARRKLYKELKEEIDSARAAYAREFLSAAPSMPDYLHLELLRTLANEEVAALGEEYPGPLR
jgi:hypothetical protein